MKNLATALIAAQKDFPPIPKDGRGNFGSHATLHTIFELAMPHLHENGLTLIQHPTTVDGQPALRTKLVHAESGEFDEDTMLLVLDKNNPQGQGSALTYARRYAALAVLGLVADDDDDGAAASRPKVSREKNKPVARLANDLPASQPQKNRLFAIVGELAEQRGVAPAQVLSALKDALNIDSLSELNQSDATKADALLAAWQKKVEAKA